MKNPKTIALLYTIVGIALALVSIYGYDLGIARRETFGAFQWAGTLFGIALTIFGLLRLMKNK